MPEISTAERAGVGSDGHPRPTEDHVALLDQAILVLDGATSPSPDLPPGGWYAHLLRDQLAQELRTAPHQDLSDALATAIAAVAKNNALTPGNSPSSTVSILRWSDQEIEALVLADSPIVAFGHFGADVVSDDRLISLRNNGLLQTGKDVRRRRNAEDGFWVAEADPSAARKAVRRSWPRKDVNAVLIATDGVAIGVDEYGIFTWPEVLQLAKNKGPEAVLDAVRAAENDDPHAVRWPRAKRHDDQVLVLADFAG
ncbi:protein phosphatase 2C domain-containing protein [Amycolatopsis dendrobii]|uniref:Protein phosphatase 2C domain-containing protein n=1 Tax=Amycolatopsis dendrobii TaxID=2760662 RepID=A0A7W3ZDK0_9PSEU|nr:protein phosphatase 2C domain-containing protein [Amycolatopsis dendrobii]MBB1157018.1 protein phosphatase 2C domain-containing protein [Amycolatopsis dendrobii]